MVKRLVGLCAVYYASALAPPASTRARSVGTVCGAGYTLDDQAIGSALTPVGDYVLVKVDEGKAQTSGGIIMPDQAKEKPTEGVVAACGPGRNHADTGVLLKMPVAEGERVLYGKFDGQPLKYGGDDHQLIRDDDVLLAWAEGAATLETVRCIRDRVLVAVTKVEDTTSSGLALAPGAAEQTKTSAGQVVKVGDGKVASDGSLIPVPVAVGEYVKFRDYAGAEVKLGGNDYVLCKASDCLAKWQE